MVQNEMIEGEVKILASQTQELIYHAFIKVR